MFDVEKFMATTYARRTETVVLSDFPEAGESAEWLIGSLSAEELAEADEAVAKNQALDSLLETVAKAVGETSGIRERISVIQEVLGISGKVSNILIKRYTLFRLGSIEPVMDQKAVIKFARVHPVEFQILTDKIFTLTGMGQSAKKKP